ncbi:MAG: branched-chain amino acid ABC transporter permease [Thermodesulfobacteriota bacterium]
MQLAVNTLVLASVYGLIAAGYVIIYRASRVINFAHGDFMMLGGYLLFTVLAGLGVRGWGGVIMATAITLAVSFLLSLLAYRLLIHSMLGQPVYIVVMVTIGLSVLMRGVATFIWGAEPKPLITWMGVQNRSLSLGYAALSTVDLLFVMVLVCALLGLALFYKYMRWGLQSTASSEDPLLAAQRGVNIYVLFALSWGLAALLATAAGILYGTNNKIEPEMGFLGLKAMPVALVGGMYSLLGLVPGALIVSLAENVVAQYFDPLVSDMVPMLILLVVLIVRPWGIFGKEEEIERV